MDKKSSTEIMRVVQKEQDAKAAARSNKGVITAAILNMRRSNMSVEQIAERLGFESGFDVIKILNEVHAPAPNLNVKVVKYDIDNQIDEFINVYSPQAKNGDLKAAEFIRKMLETKARLHGAIAAPQVSVQIDSKRPWEKVYAATLTDGDDPSVKENDDKVGDKENDKQERDKDKVIEGQIVESEYGSWHT